MDCFAAQLGNCSGNLSREHYVSRSVLELAGKSVRISGFPWQKPNIPKDVGISSLTSKILCRRHNSELSSLDFVGKDFLQSLKSSFDEATGENEFCDKSFSIQGDMLELWLLKILCGILSTARKYTIPESWVEYLYQKRPFPEQSGIHFFGIEGTASWYFNLLRIISVPGKLGGIAGAKFGIGGLAVLLGFGKPIFEEAQFQSLYRPASIRITKGSGIQNLNFSWKDYEGKGSLTLHIDKIISGGELRPMPIVELD